MIDRLIACTWITKGYEDLALEQTDNLARFGIEHVIIDDPITQDDYRTPTFIDKHPFIITKDRAQCDFLRSLPASYSQVLFLDAEVRLHQSIPAHWDRSVLWHNNPVWLPGRSQFMKRINVGQMIWHRDDKDMFRDSIRFALDELPSYDIEMAMDVIVGDRIPIEFLRGIWFPDLYRGHAATRHYRDYENSQRLDAYDPTVVGTLALLDTKPATAGQGRYDGNIIMTHPPFYQKKSQILYEQNDSKTIMTIFIEFLLTAVCDDSISAWKLFHWFNDGNTNDDLDAIDVGNMESRWPSILDRKHVVQFGQHRVYEFKGWLLCPSLSLAAPIEHWNKPFLVENEFGFKSSLLTMPGIADGTDTDLTTRHHIV